MQVALPYITCAAIVLYKFTRPVLDSIRRAIRTAGL
jgi:hypothetical protein